MDLYLTWVGDIATAVREWIWARYYKGDPRPKSIQAHLKERAGREELLGDIDGVNLGATYDASRPLSENLAKSCAGRPDRRRFRDFLRNTMTDDGADRALQLSSRNPPTLSAEARAFIARQVSEFLIQTYLFFHLLDKDRAKEIRDKFGSSSFMPPEAQAAMQPDSRQVLEVTDYFARFVEAGLAAEAKR